MMDEIGDTPFPFERDIQEAHRVNRTLVQVSELLGNCQEKTYKGDVFCELVRHMHTLRRLYTPELTGEELGLLEKTEPKYHKAYSRGILDSFEVRASVPSVSLLTEV